jgi:hypothetical protein
MRNQHLHPLYSVYHGMKQRCYNPNIKQFHDYGGRGIVVCERWLAAFDNFIIDMPTRHPGQEIDRIDNDGPYSPENCRWSTHKENMRNRRNTVFVTIGGVEHLLSELAEKYKLKPDTIKERAEKGMVFSDVVSSTRFRNLTGLALGGEANGDKRRAATHCKNGHEFTDANTSMTRQGWRVCRTCKRDRQRQYVNRKQ